MHVDTIGTVLGTRVDTDSESFGRNRDRNLELVDQVRDLLDEAAAGGDRRRSPATANAASCCCVNASSCCSTQARRGWNCRP